MNEPHVQTFFDILMLPTTSAHTSSHSYLKTKPRRLISGTSPYRLKKKRKKKEKKKERKKEAKRNEKKRRKKRRKKQSNQNSQIQKEKNPPNPSSHNKPSKKTSSSSAAKFPTHTLSYFARNPTSRKSMARIPLGPNPIPALFFHFSKRKNKEEGENVGVSNASN